MPSWCGSLNRALYRGGRQRGGTELEMQERPEIEDLDESAVIVTIGEVEPAVAGHRRYLDIASSWGVPAHVTVLYPFVRPRSLDDTVIERLGAAINSVPSFDCTFSRCDWFDDEVLWLAPEPDQGFRDLTAAVFREFPDTPPYGGNVEHPIPHLTVGDRTRIPVPPAALRAAEVNVTRQLPIATRVERALLMAGAQRVSSWSSIREFSLGDL